MEASVTGARDDGHNAREAALPAAREAEYNPSQDRTQDSGDESSTQSESWISRAQYRTDELRRLFDLPEGEVSEGNSLPGAHAAVHLTLNAAESRLSSHSGICQCAERL
jgi:hypothetical protein